MTDEGVVFKKIEVSVKPGVSVNPTLVAIEEENKKLKEEAETKVKQRAERFNIPVTGGPIPGVTAPLERKIRKMNTNESFAVGFDLFSKDEQAKKELRMHRFHGKNDTTTTTSMTKKKEEEEDWKNDESRKGAREARFGVVVQKREREDVAVVVPKRSWKVARREQGEGEVIRKDSLYIHGLDTWKTADVKREVKGAIAMEWVDDSSCTVTFPDEFAAQRWLRKEGKQEADDTTWWTWKGGKTMRQATEQDIKRRYFEQQKDVVAVAQQEPLEANAESSKKAKIDVEDDEIDVLN